MLYDACACARWYAVLRGRCRAHGAGHIFRFVGCLRATQRTAERAIHHTVGHRIRTCHTTFLGEEVRTSCRNIAPLVLSHSTTGGNTLQRSTTCCNIARHVAAARHGAMQHTVAAADRRFRRRQSIDRSVRRGREPHPRLCVGPAGVTRPCTHTLTHTSAPKHLHGRAQTNTRRRTSRAYSLAAPRRRVPVPSGRRTC